MAWILLDTDTLATFSFLSPVLYVGVLGIALIARELGWVKPFDPIYHNYNMILQSCLLMGVSVYDYIATVTRSDSEWTEMVAVSHESALWHRQTCDTNWVTNAALVTFLVSKVFEWFDTVALIINRKKLIALHVWHHATIGVAFYTGYFTSAVLWIGFLNSFIHVIMYAHYANVPGVRKFARYLTQLQIIQLFGGVYMNYRSYLHFSEPRYQNYAVINGAIALSYGLMFLKFYVNKYKKG